MPRSIAICLALALSLGVPGCVRFTVGQAAYDRGDYARARAVWRSLARRGDAEGQYRLAMLYALGQGLPQDEQAAARWFRAAADQGHAEAEAKLTYMYLDGRGGAEEDPQAEPRLRAAAERGAADAQFKLGVLYMKGTGIPKNPDEALRWFSRAQSNWPKGSRPMGELIAERDLLRELAERGLPAAEVRLGQIYDMGQDVPQSHAEAVKWYFLAARQGFVPGQIALGWSFSQGTGVPKDPIQAARWFEKAAQRGDPWAQYQMGLCFQLGVGVQRDLIRSHMWFNLAAATGAADSREKRDEVAAQMTLAEITEAERLALAWKPESPDAANAEPDR